MHTAYTRLRRRWQPTPVLSPGKSHSGGAWRAAVRGVAKSRTRLSDFTFTFHFHALEKEMGTLSSVLAWRIPGTEEPSGLLSMGSQSRTRLNDFTFSFHFLLSCIGEGNGNPLQGSCLENPRDSGAWWAAVYGVTQSWAGLMRLSSSKYLIVVIKMIGRTN